MCYECKEQNQFTKNLNARLHIAQVFQQIRVDPSSQLMGASIQLKVWERRNVEGSEVSRKCSRIALLTKSGFAAL